MHYTIVRSDRYRNISISVKPDTTVHVKSPTYLDLATIEKFIETKIDWIERNIEKMKQKTRIDTGHDATKHYQAHLQFARETLSERLNYWSKCMQIRYKSLTIRNQKTKWGSCSNTGRINLSYKIIFLPKKIQDYILVHELSHIVHLNHSKQFWLLVEKYIPDYKILRTRLKNII